MLEEWKGEKFVYAYFLRRHYPDQVQGVEAVSLLSADSIQLPSNLFTIYTIVASFCQFDGFTTGIHLRKPDKLINTHY